MQSVSTRYGPMLDHLRRDPYGLYEKRVQFAEGQDGYHPNLSYLKVCMCSNVSPAMRCFAEAKVHELLLNKYPGNLENREMTIVSIGAFGCYQEMVLLAKLSEQFKKFKLLLCDIKPISCENTETFCREVFVGSETSIHVFSGRGALNDCLLDLKNKTLSPDVFLAVDLSDPQCNEGEELLASYAWRRLQEQGVDLSSTIFVRSDRDSQTRSMDVATGYNGGSFASQEKLTEDLDSSLLDRGVFRHPWE